MKNYGEAINFGFKRLERLDGNIGYIKLDLFFPIQLSAETVAASMNWISHTEALIIDLRENDGGMPETVTFLTSYLLGPQPVKYGGMYVRATDSIEQQWTMPYVPGERYLGKPVYLLISKRTFSAAEAFAYNLQVLKRVTVIGETTEGGAHPRDVVRLDEHFWAGVPVARGVNPVTGTDWEGVGVKPDVATSASEALLTAHRLAIQERIARSTDEDEKKRLSDLLERLR